MQLETLAFTFDHVAAAKTLSSTPIGVHGAEFTVRRQYKKHCEELVVELSAFVLQQEYESRSHTVSFDVPKTWWDAFKLWAFPEPMLSVWPAQYKTLSQTVEFTVGARFPEASFKVPRDTFGKPVYFTKLEVE